MTAVLPTPSVTVDDFRDERTRLCYNGEKVALTFSDTEMERRLAGLRAHMAAAGIPEGPHACPKGLRHGFGVQAVSRGVALNMVQKWLGHAQLTTTAIYANAVGEEEQSIAARMW